MSPQDATETAPQAAASPAIGRKLGLALLVIATAQLMLVLDDVRGYSAMHTGLAYLPYVAGVGLASGGFGPRLLGARPARAVIAAGMIICASGLAWYVMALTPASNYYAVMLPAMLAGGVGTGLTFVGCTVVGMRAVAPRDSGIAAGLLNTSLQCGSALGLGALAAIASMVTRSHLPGHTVAAALTDGYVAGLLAGSVIFTRSGSGRRPGSGASVTSRNSRSSCTPSWAGRPPTRTCAVARGPTPWPDSTAGSSGACSTRHRPCSAREACCSGRSRRSPTRPPIALCSPRSARETTAAPKSPPRSAG